MKAPQAVTCVNVSPGELKANEVVMTDTATTVRFTMEKPKGKGFRFASSSYLMDNSGNRYALPHYITDHLAYHFNKNPKKK